MSGPSPFSPPSTPLGRTLAALVALELAVIAAVLLVHFLEIGRVDNGDGERVLRHAYGAVTPSEALHLKLLRSRPMLPVERLSASHFLPTSTSGALVLVLATFHKLFGFDSFYTASLTATYFLLYFVGAGLWWRAAATRARKLLVGTLHIALLLNPFVVSYFNSPLEEAFCIAAAPLWSYFGWRATQTARTLPFHVTSVALVLAKSACLPLAIPSLVLAAVRNPRPPFGPALVLLAILLSFARGTSAYGTINAYNRVFNGLAYTASGVGNWPASNYAQRLARAPDLVRADTFDRFGLDERLRPLWGTSYWPTGASLSRRALAEATEPGRIGGLLLLLARNPVASARLVTESYRAAVRADYVVDHWLVSSGFPALWWRSFDPVARHHGVVFLVAIGTAIVGLLRRDLIATAFSLPVLVAPTFVVVGDGFFEFEKHLFPYFVPLFAIACATAALTGDDHDQNDSSPRSHADNSVQTSLPSSS